MTARRHAEEALRQSDRAKDEFLAVLGHELRNPLAPLVTGLSVLERADSNPELVAELTAMMQRQVGHLRRLVDDLLDIARISRNKLELRRATLSLHEPIHAAVEQLRSLLVERDHDLSLSLAPVELHVDGDRERLTQVFANLLRNAAKYMEPGGRVHVQTALERDSAGSRCRAT